jgi:ABC-type transporter Mla subunit MlaD
METGFPVLPALFVVVALAFVGGLGLAACGVGGETE